MPAGIWKWKPTPGKSCPEKLQAGTVVEQVAREYQWTLEQMEEDRVYGRKN